MATSRSAPPGHSPALITRAALPVLVSTMMLVAGGCASADGESVTRPGSGQAGSAVAAEPVGKSLTWILPDKRQPAPVASGPALSGNGTVSSDDYPGKVVVINVWGSWCGPCRAEARDLAAASRASRKKAAFVGINIRDNNPDTARAFVRAFDVPYPHIYDPDGKQLVRFAGTLPPNGIPATLIIDREGRIAGRVVGVVDKTTLLGLIDDAYAGR